MIRLLAFAAFLAAAFQCQRDWTLSVSQGDALRFEGIGAAMERLAPTTYLDFQTWLTQIVSTDAVVFYARFIHTFPVLAVCLFVGGFLWMLGGPMKKPAQRMVFVRS